MHQDLFDQLESRIMNWFDSLNNQNTRDTPGGQLRIPPFLIENPDGGFSLKVVDPNNPSPIDEYLLPVEFANQILSPDQQADLRERVYEDVVNARRSNFGGRRRKTRRTRTKRRTRRTRTRTKRRTRRTK